MNQPLQEGHYWPGQGGVFIGTYRDGDNRYHLVLAVSEESIFDAPWGQYGNTIEGEFSAIDGAHNTDLILASEPENIAANRVKNLVIDGHSDFHIAAQKQLMLGHINTPELFEKRWHWSSTQYSACNAWIQDFEDGHTLIGNKVNKRAVRAVRRVLVIQ
jgi:hypothetical protein